MKSRTWKAALGLVGACAAVAAGAFAPTASAQAADTIDPNHSVTLNIYKYEGDPVSPQPTPATAPTGLTPLPGVTFELKRLTNVDLSTNAGWATLSQVTAAQLSDADSTNDGGVTLGAPISKVTDAQGLATATSPEITVGAYLVTEKSFGNYTIAAPFIVTLPHEDTNGTWNYTQNVYPKNQKLQPTKVANDDNATIGKNIDYTVNLPVPAGNLTTFAMEDQLVADLKLVTSPITVTASNAAVSLDPATDYTVDTTNNKLTVTFTDAGRAKLQQQRTSDPALSVAVKFAATVATMPASGVITNTATLVGPNGLRVSTDADLNNDGTPETPTSTTFANLTVTKTGGTDNSKLNGATFELYRCTETAVGSGKYTLQGAALSMSTDATGTQGTTITTANGVNGGAASTAQAFAVPVSSTNTDTTGTVSETYCVLETNAPDGFVRNPEPQLVKYTAGTAGAAGVLEVTVNNQPNTILGNLPATGAWGVGLILLLGLVLVIRGIVTSRRDQEERASVA